MNNESIKAMLPVLRKEAGLSQDELASRAGYNVITINRYEDVSNNSRINIDILEDILTVLGYEMTIVKKG